LKIYLKLKYINLRKGLLFDMKKLMHEIVHPQNLIVIICGVIALATGFYALKIMPAERVISSFGVFWFKLQPFIFGALAIAFFKREYCDFLVKTRLVFLVLAAGFLIYFANLIPKLTYFVNAIPWGYLTPQEGFEGAYYTLLIQVPFMILFMSFIFRVSGASISNTLRMSYAFLAIQLSGIEDLAIQVLHGFPIKEEWYWASHMAVRLGGRLATKYEAFGFIIFHFILAGLIIFVPWGKIKPIKWLTQKIKTTFA